MSRLYLRDSFFIKILARNSPIGIILRDYPEIPRYLYLFILDIYEGILMLTVTGMVEWVEMLGQQYLGSTVQQYVGFFLILLCSVVIGQSLRSFIENYVKRFAAKTKTNLDDIIVRAIRKPLPLLIFAIGIYVGLQILTLTDPLVVIANIVFKLFIILFFAYFSLRLTDRLTEDHFIPKAEKTGTNLDNHLIPHLSKTIKAFIFIIAVLMTLSFLGINVTSLVAGLGIGGLAVALAAQDTLANIFGSFTIVADKPFKVGDRVKIHDYEGFVETIGMRSINLRTSDGRMIVMPNKSVVNRSVINYHHYNRRRVKEFLRLKHDTPVAKIDEAKKIATNILETTKGVQKGFQVHFTTLAEVSLDIELRYFTGGNRNRDLREAKDKVNSRILREFEKAGIEFAIPIQNVVLERNS